MTKRLNDKQISRLEQSCSVALCTYNGEKYLEELLVSILSQTLPPDEIIIVDDCSLDGTVLLLKSFAEKFPQIKLNLQSSNLGPISAFQLAISLTSRPFIFLADQDDIWSPRKIELMLLSGTGHRSDLPLLAFTDLEVIDEKGDLVSTSFWEMTGLQPHLTSFKSLMFGNVVTGCASLINAKMREYLIFIPQGVLMHDHWMALIAYGFGQVEIIDQPLVKYRTHLQAVTEKARAGFRWKLKKQFSQFSREQFLENEIKQMREFAKLNLNKLSKEDRKHLLQFIKLRGKSLLRKKIISLIRFRKRK